MKIRYYDDYISQDLKNYLKEEWKPVEGVPGLFQVGPSGGLENSKSLQFLCELYESLKAELNQVLTRRLQDREFIDQRTKACFELNQNLRTDFLDPKYQTIIGQEDGQGRIVVGPLQENYAKSGYGKPVAPIPEFLQGHHVTLFGPPDDPKLSINAMNAYHRKLKNEPPIIEEVLQNLSSLPKWGADDEDSKTPLRQDLISAGVNLTGCFDGTIEFRDPKNQKLYQLENERLSLPIKRFPGLALPSCFLFLNEEPLPLHLYDFALHLFQNWHNPKALAFYVPKLENEEEARYIRHMMETAERMIQKLHPEYKVGSIRLFIVLENPRAIFRAHEIMDELYPYFAGASLGWHDYLASTARLFKEDGNYRIPVKADPDIVIKYIKASHSLLSDVVGSRGGIKIGGMYGVLPMDNELSGASFQITIKGFIRDVITQMKRNLSGFWVAHPDFVRIGLALTEAWKMYAQGDREKLFSLVKSLLDPSYHAEIIRFIEGPDLQGLDADDPRFARSLIVADIKESNFIANHYPDEIRYNVFQSLQYLTDWLSGNGCVALPAQIEGQPVRVMDDLATAERSRWEVWHEIHHGRVSLHEFLKIAHEEMRFIRKDLSNGKKIVQVKWDERTEKWYPIAFKLMVKLMTDEKPVEFASELLLPFTIESIRNAQDPWAALAQTESRKYSIPSEIERFNNYFSICGCFEFAKEMSRNFSVDLVGAEKFIRNMNLSQIIEAASFHGDIGESKKTLDALAAQEQGLVLKEEDSLKLELQKWGAEYLKKYGVKFLISAKGKTGSEILSVLKQRMQNPPEVELDQSREALWEISRKRLEDQARPTLASKIESSLKKNKVHSAQIFVTNSKGSEQELCFGPDAHSWFELASLSKTLASAFAIEYFKARGLSLETPVNSLFTQTPSSFRLTGDCADQVQIRNLLNHTALNLHYVNGVPADREMPPITDFLSGNKTYGYEPVRVLHKPGSVFQYSGGGFLVLEHLIEALENKSIDEMTEPFFRKLGITELTFDPQTKKGRNYAHGYLKDSSLVEGTRKMFPRFAAGAVGTAKGMSQFLQKLAWAFSDSDARTPLSHETAVRMLHGQDFGSLQFMKAHMGLGVFTIEAGPNRLMLHQGANDGFRCLFLHCYQGPDQGKGFVVLCNADTNGVFFVADVAQALLEELHVTGVDNSKFKKDFDFNSLPQEQVVNLGFKELVLNAFEADIPEQIITQGPPDPWARYNLCVGSKILSVTNQKFARAENLLSDHLPIFDPELYGRQGKIMDSWESVRHNPLSHDELVFELQKPSSIHFVSISTKYHLGNQAQFVQIEGYSPEQKQWITLIEKTELLGHAIKKVRLESPSKPVSQIRVQMFPDGGLTRLGLFGDNLPNEEKETYRPLQEAKSEIFSEAIPHSKKPLTPKYRPTPQDIARNWEMVPQGAAVDLASSAFGGSLIRASNEHYGPAIQVISPYPPLNMFDGFESARSRKEGHFEEIIIGLANTSPIHRIEFDFTFFKNNNPRALALHGLIEGQWKEIVSKVELKAFAGNRFVIDLEKPQGMEQLKVTVIPDGGINRIHAWSFKK